MTAHDVLEVFKSNSEKIKAVVLDLIGKMPADLGSLGARQALTYSRGDGHAAGDKDIRLYELLP